MTHKGFHFIDRTGLAYEQPQIQKPVIVSGEDIEAEAERLASLPVPENGRRMSIICNPASGAGSGFAPGTGIALCVLKPGERTAPIRHNSSQANFCIRGAGRRSSLATSCAGWARFALRV